MRVSSRLRALSSCEVSPLRKSVYNTVVEEEERNLLLKAVNGWVASLTQLPEVSKCYLLSRFLFFATLWTVAHQVPLCMEFSRQEHWSELPLPPPWDFPNPGVEPWSPALQADSLPSELSEKPSVSTPVNRRNILSVSRGVAFVLAYFPICWPVCLPSV